MRSLRQRGSRTRMWNVEGCACQLLPLVRRGVPWTRINRGLSRSPQTARQAALRAMWDEAATENYGQYNRLEVPHMLLDDVRVGDVVELNTPTAGQTFHVFVYEIAEDEVRYRYGLMGASVGQCLMSNIVRVVGPDEEGISI